MAKRLPKHLRLLQAKINVKAKGSDAQRRSVARLIGAASFRNKKGKIVKIRRSKGISFDFVGDFFIEGQGKKRRKIKFSK